jgi:hypothetical protein
MSLRWRNHCEGEILCAAKHPELPDDCYIDDGLHYQLAVLSKVIVPDENEHTNGLWHWNPKLRWNYEDIMDCGGKVYFRG